MKRILTIQIEITDPNETAWIWNSHATNVSRHGIHVTAIHEGTIKDLIKEQES
jgi:hypothetical protein